MPSSPMSSSLPIKGEIKLAPAFAANNACCEEKHKVTFIIIPLSDNTLHVSRPSQVNGTFTATFFAILLKYSPSSIIFLA